MSKNPTTITLPSDVEIAMERVFDAPRDLVWRAHTDPERMAQWWGQRSTTTVIDKMELHQGGTWRFIERDAEGNEYAFNGVYQEIVPPERIIYTFEFEGLPGHVLTETIWFDVLAPDKTKMRVNSTFTSKEDRDGMLQSGMEIGANESWEALDELLTKEQA